MGDLPEMDYTWAYPRLSLGRYYVEIMARDCAQTGADSKSVDYAVWGLNIPTFEYKLPLGKIVMAHRKYKRPVFAAKNKEKETKGLSNHPEEFFFEKFVEDYRSGLDLTRCRILLSADLNYRGIPEVLFPIPYDPGLAEALETDQGILDYLKGAERLRKC